MSAMRIGILVAVCVLLSAICLASIASAQANWIRTYGGTGNDEGRSVQQTTDGGYIIAGYTASFGYGGLDVYLLKTNAQGDTLWTRTYGGTSTDLGNSVQQTTDGGFIIAGYTESFGAGGADVYLLKTNAQGDTLWTRTYGGPSYDAGYSVQQTTDGGYIIGGLTFSYGAGNSDVYLIKTNARGDTLWTRTHGGTKPDQGYSVRQTADSGFIVVGSSDSTSGGSGGTNVCLVKTNVSGDLQWTRGFAVGDWAEGYSVQQTTDGGFVITGTDVGGGWRPTFILRTDDAGHTVWTKLYGTGFGSGQSVQQTTDHGFVVAGYDGDPSSSSVTLMKLGEDGDALWGRTYDSGIAYSVRQTNDRGYIVAGYTSSSSAGGDDVYLIKTGANLDVGSVAILSPPGIAESGSMYVPRAVVCNFGVTAATFPVTMDIGSGYARTVQDTLASGMEDTVVFPAWTAGPMGSLAVTCFTLLAGDENPANDTIGDSIRVVPPPRHDVGAVATISPAGSVRAGDAVIPRARIKNFGNTQERFFDVRLRIGPSYSRTANVANALMPDSTVQLTFAPWVAETGNWAVSCSTMLASDVDSANDKVISSVQVFAQSLQIAPDQSDRLEAGQSKTYRFYALIQGDTGAVVEVARPSAPTGWSVRLGNATGANDLADTDGDGIPDLGYVAPGESGWFSLDVTAPSETQGDTASLAQGVFVAAGHVAGRPDIADTAVLTLTLLPEFSVHNFPNPFSDHTAFVIGLPEDGKASLTVYTRTGARVCRVLANANMSAGVHLVRWDGENDNGRGIAPGTYEYLLDYEHQGKTERIHKRLVLTRQ